MKTRIWYFTVFQGFRVGTGGLPVTFEECLDEDLVVVAKIISPNKPKAKEIFNPLKDFFVLNRATRRSMKIEDTDGLENIYAEDDYIALEILAIYQ